MARKGDLMQTFRLRWLDGTETEISGVGIEDAFDRARISVEKAEAIKFYDPITTEM